MESRWNIGEVTLSADLFRQASLTISLLVAAAADVDPTSVAFRFENQLVERFLHHHHRSVHKLTQRLKNRLTEVLQILYHVTVTRLGGV